MFKKKECYLCGGKLINGRCSSCGLDNTKLDKKNYRLNESSFDRKKKIPPAKCRREGACAKIKPGGESFLPGCPEAGPSPDAAA